MATQVLELKNYSVLINRKELLKDVDLGISKGEIHLLIGANGSGKSTLLKSLMFDKYQTKGTCSYLGKDLRTTSTPNRAKNGIFLAHQEPTEVPGVPILDFLRLSYNEIHEDKPVDPWTFKEIFDVYAEAVGLGDEYSYRNLNEDFSGGEKKKLELLQLLVLKPVLALVDELDSGLDYKSLERMFSILDEFSKEQMTALILVSHNKNILDYIEPDKVHLIENGSIIRSGSSEILK